MIRAEAPSRRQKNKLSYVEPQTQSSEKLPSSQEDVWFEIKEIVGERKNSYRISWAGEDPATGQPWKREWVCATPQLTIPVGLRLTPVYAIAEAEDRGYRGRDKRVEVEETGPEGG